MTISRFNAQLAPTAFALTLTALATAGCGSDDPAAEYRDVLPSVDAIAIPSPPPRVSAPSSSTQASPGAEELVGLVLPNLDSEAGDEAHYYAFFTRLVDGVNAPARALINIVQRIGQHKPRFVDATHAEWEPEPDANVAIVWRLRVDELPRAQSSKGHDGVYAFALEGRPNDADDSAYNAVVSGQYDTHHNPRTEPLGSVTIDLDVLKALDPTHTPSATGHINLFYTPPQERDDFPGGKPRHVSAAVSIADASFMISCSADRIGFANVIGRVAARESYTDIELAAQWLPTGAGAARISRYPDPLLGMEPPGAVAPTISECWGPEGKLTYYEDPADGAAGFGDPNECPNPFWTVAPPGG